MKDQIFVTRPFLPPKEDYFRCVERIWSNRWLTNNGEFVQKLETELREWIGTPNILVQTNGHIALETALRALHVSGEVITTPFTFASTTHAITRTGAKPVFCDIREDNLTLDPDRIEALITDKTSAILPVHVYGHPCDTEAIDRIAKKHHLKVIYDGAHAFGVRVKGKSLVCEGDISMLSFHSTKLFHTIEGGALVYRDDSLRYTIEGERNYGIRNEVVVDQAGGNAKMSEFQAAMGVCNLEHIAEIIAERKAITLEYRRELADIPGVRFFTPESEDVQYNYAYMPVLIQEGFGLSRDDVYARLKDKGIMTRRYFYPLTSDFECYASEALPDEKLPVARRVVRQVLALPIYNGLSPEQVRMICEEIRAMRDGA